MASLATATINAPGMPPVALRGHRFGAQKWRKQMGLTPVEVTWRLPVAEAALVLAQREVSLTFTPADGKGKPQTWSRIVVVGEGPTDDPQVRSVIVSDVRWYLLRVNLIAAYNRRVFSGQRSLTDPGGFSFATAPATDQVTYAISTLRNSASQSPVAWKASEMILAPGGVFDLLAQLVAASGAPAFGAPRDLSSLVKRGTWNPSDVSLDAAGNVALGQALGSVGGVDVRVGDDGVLELVDALLGAEKSLIQAVCTSSLASGAGPGATPKGVMRYCAMNHVAPANLSVAYTRELEVRADSWEPATVGSSIYAQIYSSDAPWAEPVIRVSDLQLSVNQPGNNPQFYTAVQSTPVPVDPWFSAVAAKGDAVNAPPGYEAISRTVVQQNYLSDVLSLLYTDSPVDPLGPSRLWSARVGEIMSDYRNLFRLNPRFARRCYPGTIVASRAALLNAATGERQPSPVYRDYYDRPTTRGLVNAQRIGNQVTCIPPLGGQTFNLAGRTYDDPSFPDQVFPLEQAQFAPFKLGVEDAVNGVFRIAPRLLPGQETSNVLPGLITQAPGIDTFQFVEGAEIPLLEFCALIATDRVTFIFSAVPVGPSGAPQVHLYPVTAGQALARLGVSGDAVTAQGPTWTIRVGDGVQRARVPWTDATRAATLGAFMTGQGNPQQLVPVNDAALQDYSVACSAVFMATMLDHFEGTQELPFSPTIAPVGSLQVVEHSITATGELYTDLHCSYVTPTLRPESFMSQSSRNAIFGNLGGALPA